VTGTAGPAAAVRGESAAPLTDGDRPRLVVEEDLRRGRLVSLLRAPLAVPHLLWLALWTALSLAALPVGWLAALGSGRLPAALHRFLTAYVRAATHLISFATGAANPFPGFLGVLPYPVDVVLPGPSTQRRVTVAARPILALAAVAVAVGAALVLTLCAIPGWAASVVLGRVPAALHGVLVGCVRYLALTLAYVLLLTERYPRLGTDSRR
jgi:hypothetical protein